MPKWIKLKAYPGVRYYEHESRRYNNRPDRNYYIRFKCDGKLVEESCGWASEGMSPAKASQWRGEIVQNIRSGRGPRSLKESRKLAEERAAEEKLRAIRFSDFWEVIYMPSCEKEKKRASITAEKSWFKNWIEPAIGKTPLVDVSPFDIERIKNNMAQKGLSARSVQYCLATIRQVFNVAFRRGYFVGVNPVKSVQVKIGDNKRIRFLTPEEADVLLTELDNRSLQLHDMAFLALHTGLRAGEIFSLTWDCVDFDQASLFIRDTKSGRNRHVYMTAAVKDMMKNHYQEFSSGLVFPNRYGCRIKRISPAFARAVDSVGLNEGITDPRQKVVFHTLRHTFASWLVQSGELLYTVAKLMGHTTTAMTERYSHLAPGNLRGAVEQIGKRITKKGGVIIDLRK